MPSRRALFAGAALVFVGGADDVDARARFGRIGTGRRLTRARRGAHGTLARARRHTGRAERGERAARIEPARAAPGLARRDGARAVRRAVDDQLHSERAAAPREALELDTGLHEEARGRRRIDEQIGGLA